MTYSGRILLPLVALALFGWITYRSYVAELNTKGYWRYRPGFTWGNLYLNKPESMILQRPSPQPPTDETRGIVIEWDVHDHKTAMPLSQALLFLVGIPGVLAGLAWMQLLKLFGVSELTAFFTTMPVCLVVWYYALGRWIDLRRANRRLAPDFKTL